MNIPLVMLIIYIILLYAISWYSTQLMKRGTGGALEYLLAGRGFPMIVVATMLTGMAVGGASTVGVAENAYSAGLSAGWYNAAWGTGGLLVGLIAAHHFRRLEVTTIPELFERYYGTSARIIGVIGQLIVQMVITSLQYVAGGAVLAALLPDIFTFNSGMMVTAIVFVGMTIVGGYWAAGLSNVINVAVIYIGVIIAVTSAISIFGGMPTVVTKLPPGPWFSWVDGVGVAVVTAWMIVMITQAFSTQAVTQIAFAAKDEKAARRGFILGGLMIMPIGFICALFGIIAAAEFPGLETAAMALPTVTMQLNPIISGLLLSALWAADISTAVGLLMGSSTLIAEDIWRRFFRPNMDQAEQIRASRLCVFCVAIATYFLALTSRGILATITTGLGITTSFTILLLASIFLPNLCKKSSAFWTVLVSIVVWLLWTLVPAFRVTPHIIYLEWPLCLLTFGLCSVLDKRKIDVTVQQA